MSYTNRGFDSEDKSIIGGGWRAPDHDHGQDLLPKICIIGSGDFGRALAGRLDKSGYKVTIASRDIHRNRQVLGYQERRTVYKLNVK